MADTTDTAELTPAQAALDMAAIEHKAEFILAKNRHGSTGIIDMGWDGPHTKFYGAMSMNDRTTKTAGWQPIATAPTDGSLVWVYTAERDGLPAFQGPCAYHSDAGWCTDELREVTHWMPLSAVYQEPPR